jgi:molybdopterin molybdotransferase
MVKKPPLPLEEAQARLLALVKPLPVEETDIEEAVGRYAASSLNSIRTQPAADMSAMDGYAMFAGDTTGPWKVIGESAAGHPFVGSISAGQAVRISTGAVIPDGGGIIVLQEDLRRDGDRIILMGDMPKPADKHIRRRGNDFWQGIEILPSGAKIGPAQAALVVAAGHTHLSVRQRPVITVIDSGDELTLTGGACAEHQIPPSNGIMLAAMLRSVPATVRRKGPIPDTVEAIAQALNQSIDADVIVTSGGASVGEHDLMKRAMAACGAELDFWQVAIKPGKPILVATREGGAKSQLIIGLPGNPVSCYVTAHLFLLPIVRAMLGAAVPLPQKATVLLGAPLKSSGSRREFLRAHWDGKNIFSQPVQDTGAIAPLAASNALIDRAAKAPSAEAGEAVQAYLLDGAIW